MSLPESDSLTEFLVSQGQEVISPNRYREAALELVRGLVPDTETEGDLYLDFSRLLTTYEVNLLGLACWERLVDEPTVDVNPVGSVGCPMTSLPLAQAMATSFQLPFFGVGIDGDTYGTPVPLECLVATTSQSLLSVASTDAIDWGAAIGVVLVGEVSVFGLSGESLAYSLFTFEDLVEVVDG